MEFAILLFFSIIGAAILVSVVEGKKRKKEIERIKSLPLEEKKFELMKLQGKIGEFKTNHLLHFFLSLFMIGIWIIPWFFIAQSNGARRKEINEMIDQI